MNDSFSQLAKTIRLNKINKKEIQKIKREIIDDKVYKIIKNDMAIKIQKIIRGILYRKQFSILLDEINKETIINYLYEKKLDRIKKEYRKIISYHLSNYIKNFREEKEKINKHKIQCIDLIKAFLRGIIFRKKFNNEISLLKEIKDKIERYILGYKIKLILRSNNIQSLLIDIANIKYSLNDIDKTNDSNNQKIKEYKTKLTKNINLFYFTFYQMKENSNWISQTKIKDPWIKKYMSIINKNNENAQNNNIFIKKKSIYSNQKKIKRLKENNNKNSDNKKDILKSSEFKFNNTMNYEKEINNEKEIVNSENNSNIGVLKENKENKDNNNSSINNSDINNNSIKNEKKYDFNFYDSENEESNENINRKILHKGTEIYSNKNSKNEIKIKKNRTIKDDDTNQEKNINEEKDKKIRSNIVKRYKAKKLDSEQKLSPNQSKSKSDENKEEIIKREKEINNYKENEENEPKEEIEDNNEDNNEEKNEEINKENNEENNKENSKENIAEKNEEKNIEKEAENEIENVAKKLNKYQQREERPIKPLTNINFLENENPFGLRRESSENISENQNLNLEQTSKKNTIEKRIISSTRAINRAIITYNEKGKNKKQNISEIEKEETTIKTQEKTDLSHEDIPVSNKYIEYDNRPCGGAKNSEFYNLSKYDDFQVTEKIDRNERPLVGAKKIDYNAMFGEGAIEFEGDPFGGAKQYESSNKDKVKNVNIHKSNTIKKKPVYDARKAIEEAKLKEAKEGKKEKPSAFREFLREMKKISAEEKAEHNETNADNLKPEKKIKNKNNKNEIKENNLEIKTESNINVNKLDKLDEEEKILKKNTVKKQDKKLNLNIENEEYIKNDNNPMILDEKENTLKKKHRGSLANKGTETKEIALRRKLHELEKAPAPVLNIKGIKSRIECWSGNSDNKRGKMNSLANKSKDTPKSKDEKKNKNNKNNDQKTISNFINNKKIKEITVSETNNTGNNKINYKSQSTNEIPKISKNMEEKIEKYVDKKLMQLNLQIVEIDELFNFENYFKEKEDKMKNYINLPYIKQNYDYVVKYSNEDYDEKMSQIEQIYKELK